MESMLGKLMAMLRRRNSVGEISWTDPKTVKGLPQNSSRRKAMKKIILALLLVVVAVAALSASSQARPVWRGPAWHGRIDHFHEHDMVVWRGGRWFHGWHGSRLGWWWIVGGVWYWYPAPVYPYPNPYTPPVVVQVPPAPPQPQSLPQTWYYCDRPAGYYPYVPECASGWRAVPATPPPALSAPPPPR
jgi:hypothetical protein